MRICFDDAQLPRALQEPEWDPGRNGHIRHRVPLHRELHGYLENSVVAGGECRTQCIVSNVCILFLVGVYYMVRAHNFALIPPHELSFLWMSIWSKLQSFIPLLSFHLMNSP